MKHNLEIGKIDSRDTTKIFYILINENIISAKKLKTQKSVKLKRGEQQLRQFISKKAAVRLKRRKRDLKKIKKTNRKLIMPLPRKRMTFSIEKKNDNLFVLNLF
jgi:hypothetical protein